VDGSVLFIREYIDARYKIEKVSYAYQYQDGEGTQNFTIQKHCCFSLRSQRSLATIRSGREKRISLTEPTEPAEKVKLQPPDFSKLTAALFIVGFENFPMI
jgi:hypothetical protein